MSNSPPQRPSPQAGYRPLGKPVTSMTKVELEEKVKGYKFVLFKLHQEIEQKDAEIARLNALLDKAQKRQG